MNIEGKRSGSGFIAHKAILVSALSRALAERVTLIDITIGRKGLLGYLKALGGSNVIKVIPSADSASGSQADGHKKLKVICGANTGYIADKEWIGDKTPLSLCDVRVSPNNSIKPNIGSLELAEALNKVLPFTASEDNRPVFQCVNFAAKDGKLTLVSADGFRLAITSMDYDDGEGQVLVNRDGLKGIINALKKAKRARVSFEPCGESIGGYYLIIDTELIRYKWMGVNADYPEYEKLIPTEFNTFAHLDTVEAIKAVNSLNALSDSKAYPIDLTIGNGRIVMANPDDKGQAELTADTEGEGKVRVDGNYLAQALKACGGMVDFSLTNAYSPMLFSSNGFKLVVMPMLTNEANEQAKRDKEAREAQAKVEASQPTDTADTASEAEKAQAVAEAEAITKGTKSKKKRSKSKEPVAVA